MKKYEAYRDSGVEWLGDTPKHWAVDRIKNIGVVNGRVGWKALKASEYIDSGYFFLSTPNIKNIEIDYCNVNYITEERYSESPEIMLHNDDILLVKDGSTLGIVNIISNLPSEGTVNSSIAVLRFRKVVQKYIYYLLTSSYIQTIIAIKKGGMGVPHLFQRDINNFFLLLPPNREQTEIANYLDNKTRIIDRKVDLLKQKIVHFKALRKSIINDAVTKGLDKNVKLRDSGVSWIGEIPKHWDVMRMKDIFNISRGRAIGKTELKNQGKYPVYSSQTKRNGILGYINTYDFNADLLTWTTDGANAGTIFRRSGKFNCTNICGTLIPKNSSKLSLEYMAYATQLGAIHNKRIDTNGAKIMSNEMAVINVMFPPKQEQSQIAHYLDEKTTRIDKIIANITQQINTLTVLRKTLINDLVTGKLKPE